MSGLAHPGDASLRLYHGSNAPVEQPSVAFNTGFSDLGRGFYLTDDRAAARHRAASRARREGEQLGVVSCYSFDESCVSWVLWGDAGLGLSQEALSAPFGLRFARDTAGIAAWVDYIKRCRQGMTALDQLGDPAVVRAWIATEEVEMACSGLVSAADLAEFIDPTSLVTQYCFRDQVLVDTQLQFVGTEVVEAEDSGA